MKTINEYLFSKKSDLDKIGTLFLVPATETNTKNIQSYHFRDTDIWLVEEDMDRIIEFMKKSNIGNFNYKTSVKKLDSRYIRIQ